MVTAEEMIDIVADSSPKKAAESVDVVTTGTFGPMCSSGAFINVGHTTPRMKMGKVWLNNVPAYTGIAAVDLYIGATELTEDDPANKVFPGAFTYGGAHVIEDLVRGKDVLMKAVAYGTDCYPRKELETLINLNELNEAFLFNPRNAYQNYNVAVNAHSKRPIYTYLGVLRPELANANYCSAGQLSPLLNDPHYRTIGIGTRIFLGGGVGYISFAGTQHAPMSPRNKKGVPLGGAGTLALTGDLKQMRADYLRAAAVTGYGVSLAVGVGVPIPILGPDILKRTCVRDRDIMAPVVDYSKEYPEKTGKVIAHVTYEELKSGEITVDGDRVPVGSLSSYTLAREIAHLLRDEIAGGDFLLTPPSRRLPVDHSMQSLLVREKRE